MEPEQPTIERRARPRTRQESRATGIVQAILQDPTSAAADLERDLRAGGDWSVTLALLSAAEMSARARGIDLAASMVVIRRHLRRMGFAA